MYKSEETKKHERESNKFTHLTSVVLSCLVFCNIIIIILYINYVYFLSNIPDNKRIKCLYEKHTEFLYNNIKQAISLYRLISKC